MSLRERRKLERRTAILKTAERLFAEKGVTRTSMEAIADGAGLGVATVYKHFGTKAAILEDIIRPTLEKAFAEAEKVIANPPIDAAEAMAELIDKYRYLRNDWSDRRMLRALSLPGPDSKPNSKSLAAEERCQKQIRDLLLVLRGRGDISAELNLDDASAVVFCVFNQHYERFVTNDELRADTLFADMARRTKLLFQPWRKQ